MDAEVAEPVLAAGEVDAFADDDGLEAELADEAGAVPAGGEGGDHDEVAVGALAAGVAEGVGFAVEAGVGLLDAAVVAAADEGAASARKMAAPMGRPPSARPVRASSRAMRSMAG